MTSRVTLVIPTRNRSTLLCRQLAYYRETGFTGDVLVGDSSDDGSFDATGQWLKKFAAPLSVRQVHLPGLSISTAVRELRGDVRTPYVALIPDDDFLIPSAIWQCADVLERDSSYIAARGWGIVIGSVDGRPDRISAAGYYRQTGVSDDLAADRVTHFLRNYSVTLFSTHRTETWAKVWEAVPSAQDNPLCCSVPFVAELLPCSLTAAYGKIAQINRLYLVRQDHHVRFPTPTWYPWLTDEKWWPSYRWFRDKVAAAICEMDNVPLQPAQDAVEAGFATYLQGFLRVGPPPGLAERMRFAAKRYLPKAVGAVVRRARSKFGSRYLSVETLMDPGSPYYGDFLPIYNAITRKQEGIRGESVR